MNKKLRYINYAFIALLAVEFIMLCCTKTQSTHDYSFHATRIQSIAYEFKNNGLSNFPVRVYHYALGGYGYPTPLFYGDIILYIPAIFVAFCGVSAEYAYVGTMLVVSAAIVGCMYILLRRFGISRTTAVTCSFFFLFSPYLLTDYFQRSAMGECVAAAIIPLIAASFYSILHQNNEHKTRDTLTLAFSVTLLFLSHLLSTLMVCICLVIWLAAKYLYDALKKKKISLRPLGSIAVAAVISIGLSAYFLFPLIEQLRVSPDLNLYSGSGKSTPWLDTITPLSMFFSRGEFMKLVTIYYTVFHREPNVDLNELRTTGGFIYPFLMIVIVLLESRKTISKKTKKHFAVLFSAAVLFLVIMMIVPLWKLSFLTVVQFPWRLLLFFTFLLCAAAAVLLDDKDLAQRNKLFICVGFILAAIMFMTPYNVFFNHDYGKDELNSYNIGMCDYMINGYTSLDVEEWGDTITPDSGNGEYTLERTTDSTVVSYKNSSGEKIELPLIYIYGYKAVNLEDGRQLELSESEKGLAVVTLPKDASGTFEVRYEGTAVQRISNVITLAAIVSLIAWAVIHGVRSKKKQ